MVQTHDFRPRGPDRRRKSRGGRRANDTDGFAPLVLLVGDTKTTMAQAEAILVTLKFAVSTCATVVEAIRVLPDLRPEVIVIEPLHEPLVRAATQIPVVLLREPDGLINDIRRALRVTPIR